MQQLTHIIVPVSVFAMSFGIIYIWLRKQSEDRKMLLEHGADPNLLAKRPDRAKNFLKWGFVLGGTGIGILLGQLLSIYTKIDDEAAHFSMILLCAGFGMLAYYFILQDEEEASKNNKPY